MSDPARANPAARSFTRQHDVERVLKALRESDNGAMLERRKEEGEEDGEKGRLIILVIVWLKTLLIIISIFLG